MRPCACALPVAGQGGGQRAQQEPGERRVAADAAVQARLQPGAPLFTLLDGWDGSLRVCLWVCGVKVGLVFFCAAVVSRLLPDWTSRRGFALSYKACSALIRL
eukprot:366570-Chlamydomonas_euryale.AAC.10